MKRLILLAATRITCGAAFSWSLYMYVEVQPPFFSCSCEHVRSSMNSSSAMRLGLPPPSLLFHKGIWIVSLYAEHHTETQECYVLMLHE